ncbi:MAG TPA: twin-arginine translocase TatA/TatE family subunit [Anaeromyxobacter sp.]|nr:twin-arginine translocase TatA/TatE family subunit [Anaeromyxobacter sp.]
MTELAIVLLVVLFVFGATQIPALGDRIGRLVRSLRRGPADRPAAPPPPGPPAA